jgi:hypothetical protein
MQITRSIFSVSKALMASSSEGTCMNSGGLGLGLGLVSLLLSLLGGDSPSVSFRAFLWFSEL